MKKPSAKEKTDKELLELGKQVQAIFEMGYSSKKQALSMSFLKGMATGLGVFIGGTIIISLLIWGLSLFEEIPLIGNFVNDARSTLENN